MFIVLSLIYICYMLVICCLLASRLAPEAAVPCCGPTGALKISEMMGKTYGTHMEHIWKNRSRFVEFFSCTLPHG